MTFKWQFKHDLTAQTLADTVLDLHKRRSNYRIFSPKRCFERSYVRNQTNLCVLTMLSQTMSSMFFSPVNCVKSLNKRACMRRPWDHSDAHHCPSFQCPMHSLAHSFASGCSNNVLWQFPTSLSARSCNISALMPCSPYPKSTPEYVRDSANQDITFNRSPNIGGRGNMQPLTPILWNLGCLLITYSTQLRGED